MRFSKLKENTIVLMIIIIVAKVVGMFRDIVLANYFGTSSISDAYLIASAIPTLMFSLIGQGLSTAYLPMLNKVRQEKGEDAANTYSNNLSSIAVCLCAIIVLLLELFPKAFIKIFAVGFDSQTVDITLSFIRIAAFTLFFMAIINIWSGYLQSKNNFIIPAAISFPRNIVIIGSIVVAGLYNYKYLGYGLFLAYFLELLFLLPFVLKNRYFPKIYISLKDNYIKQTVLLIIPIIINVSVSQINKIVDRSLASTIVEGGISALNYASVINIGVQEVLVSGIITILFAKCSAWVAEGKHEIVKQRLSLTLDTLVYLLVPASFGIIALSDPIVRLFLSRGQFDANSVKMTSLSLICYTAGLVFLSIRDTIVRVFFAYKDTKTTTITSVLAITVNIILNFILSRFWGIYGLAIATSFSALFQSVLLYILLYRRIGDYGKNTFISGGIKSIISSILMFLIVKTLSSHAFIHLGQFISLILLITIGALSYYLLSIVLRHNIALNWFSKIRSKI